MTDKNFKCCATCINFEINKSQSRVAYRCNRLGFDTKPSYSFDCWTPKPQVIALMEKRSEKNNTNMGV
jgi:hypothetical protein